MVEILVVDVSYNLESVQTIFVHGLIYDRKAQFCKKRENK